MPSPLGPYTGLGGVSLAVSFFSFLARLQGDPVLLCTVLLSLGVILVNGWTDAPNAIATAVSTGSLPFRRAVFLAALCNFLGAAVFAALHAAVAETIYTMVDFGGDSQRALIALSASLAAIVVWSTAAWYWGIPTSESHALIAGLTGAALALQGGLANLRLLAWGRVLAGLFLSTLLGYWGGRKAGILFSRLSWSENRFLRLQVPGAAVMAFSHGAQDGQKFMGVLLLGIALAQGRQDSETFPIPLWLFLLCASLMALGTALGGRRIIDKVGRDMVPLTPRQGLAADVGGGGCLLLCSLLGLPVSTTHAKTCAILGAGTAGGRSKVRWPVFGSICRTWLLTFPGCGLLGFLFARLFFFLS